MKKLSLIIIALIAFGPMAWAQSTFSGGSGTENDPYQISTTADWNQLATDVNSGTSYSGKYFKLTQNISVTTMVGKDTKRFQGRFDGNNKTITFNVTATEDYCAPFCRISGATIKNLHTEGTIETAYRYAAGIVAYTRYYSRIENCSSSVTIRSSHAGWGGHGGILALKAWVTQSEPTIEGCIFKGKILSTGETATTGCGGIVGFTNGQTLTLKNCIYKPATLAEGETPVACSTLYENSGSKPTTVTCENCYYFENLGTAQGKEAHSISAGDCVTVAFAGTPTSYNVSGITAYKVNENVKYCGFDYNNVHYAGNGDDVSLNLTTGSNCSHDGYTATAGTLTGTSNPYTLTMPNEDVTINNVASSCPTPTNLTVNYTTGRTATVSWEGTSSTYNININDTITHNNVSSPYSLTNLALATEYSVKVQGDCGDAGTSAWTNAVTFLTTPCDTQDLCKITFELYDDYGDGWDGAAIQLKDAETNLVIGTATINDDTDYAKDSIYACSGRAVNFVWVSGDWDRETSYVVKDHVGDVIFSGHGGNGMVTNYMVDCSCDCRRPTNLAVSDIGKRSATLSWTENGSATAWKICLNGDETDLIDADSNPFTLTGLAPSTTYTAKVSSANNCSGTKWSDAITFETNVACPVPTDLTASNITDTSATFGWTSDNNNFKLRYVARPTSGSKDSGTSHTYDFEGHNMQGWTTIDADGDGYTWMVASSFFTEPDPGYNNSHDYVMSQSYYDNQALTPDNYLVSPQVMLGGRITFYACAQDEDFPNEHFGVAVSTSGNTDADDFTTLYEWTMTETGAPASKQGSWGLYTVNLSAYDGLMGYVAIRHFGCSDEFILNVDDITIVDGTGADLSWNTISNNVSNPYTLTGLTSGTSYYAQVQSVCGGDDGSSSWSGVAVITTLTACSAPHELNATTTASSATLNWAGAQCSYNVRYSIFPETTVLNEGFEGDSVSLPAGWSRTSSYWKITSGTGYDRYSQSAATGNYNVGCFARQQDYTDTLVTPAMDLSGAVSASLNFNFWNTSWGGDVNTLNVYYRVVGNGEWHLLYITDQPTDGWTAVTINLEGMAANYQIGFECVGNYSYGMGIDDVVVTKTIDFTWTDKNNVTSPYTLTNLTSGTKYQWQVQGNDCNGNGSTTDWSETGSFTTLGTYTKEITHHGAATVNGGWYLIASPLAGQTDATNVANLVNNETPENFDLYRFNESADLEWQNWKSHANDDDHYHFKLEPGWGYLYANASDVTLTFTGTPYNGDGQVTLSKTDEAPFSGWNLVGNPFTDSATLSQPYYRMNTLGSALNTETESKKVAAMEGVFVQATGNNPKVTFTAQRRGSEQAAIAQANLMVVGGNGAVIDNAILRFDGGQTLEKFSLRKGSTKIYFPQNGKDYAIACAEGQNEMPLNFEAEENGTYTLSVNVDNVELGYLHLIDNLTGADVDLLTQASYTFQAKITDYASRFRLVFATQTDADTDADAPFAFISNGNIIINGEGTLQVVDMTGRVIRCTDGVHTVSTSGMPAGVYVLRLIDGDVIRTQKMVIQTQP